MPEKKKIMNMEVAQQKKHITQLAVTLQAKLIASG